MASSNIETEHPLYADNVVDWRQSRDTYRGERIIKEQGFKYLAATSGMVEDGITSTAQKGYKAYSAYRMRARFPDVVREAVEAMLGVMHHKPPVIELPAVMEPLRERASLRNESLESLLRRINEEQLVTGRLGLLADVPESVPQEGIPLPYIALYQGEDIINWDEGERDGVEADALNLVVIDESECVRKNGDFGWEEVRKHRVLVLGDVAPNESEQTGSKYSVGVFRDDNEGPAQFDESQLTIPSIRGNTLEEIPFRFINTKDIVPTPDEGPLLGLSNLSLAIYRAEADYRQALFMQGQDTLVVVGEVGDEESTRTGAGAKIGVPIGGDAKYIGVSSQGLSEMRESLVNDYARAEEKSQGLIESVSRSAESGEALRVRVAARTASLNQIALTGAFGLQEILRIIARWVGANPEEVIVTPNVDFVADVLKGRELVDVMTAKQLGAPLSLQSIHELQQSRGLTERTWEEELELMEKEAEDGLPGAVPPGMGDDQGATGEGDPVEDDEDQGGDEGEGDEDEGDEG